MFQRLLLLCLLVLSPLLLTAQRVVQGHIIDGRDGGPIEMATVRLLALPDSALLGAVQSDSLGRFALTTSHNGKALLKVNLVSFETLLHPLQLRSAASPTLSTSALAQRGDTLQVGALALMGSDISLRSAVATATAARVEQKEDTTVFNAAAFRTAEGSTLESLVKLLPGAEVSNDGSIKVNGKTVKELLVNGKDFFKGDTQVAMKNLPTHLISRLKTYDKKSDYTEQTGIDDGEESFVLDIQTKREMNQSFVSNLDLGQGSDFDHRDLYTYKLFASRFTDRSRLSVFGSHNNVGDRGFGGFGGSNSGLTTSSMGGLDFSWENTKKRNEGGRFELGGSAFYSRRDNSTETITAAQTFLTSNTQASYTNSHAWGTNLNQYLRTHLRLRWLPDSLTTISLRPSFAWSKGNTTSKRRAATFETDPFEAYDVTTTDLVLDRAFANRTASTADAFLVNLNERTTHGQSQSHEVSGNLELTRRLSSKLGRSLNFGARGSYNNSENYSYALADIRTRRKGGALGESGTHQFSTSPSTSWNYRLNLSYIEPIVGSLLAEARYSYEHKYTDGQRLLSDLSPLSSHVGTYATLGQFIAAHSHYAGLYTLGSGSLSQADAATALSTLSSPDLYAALRDAANSQQATYHYDLHSLQLRLRLNTEKLRFTAGLSLNPERTRLNYSRPALGNIDTLRTVFTLAPQVRLTYNFSKTTRLDIFYRGHSSQPSMTQLLNVVDSSDPLNISIGNPGLRPSWNDNLRLNYNAYDAASQRGLMAHAHFSATRNAISTLLLYDANTGRRYTRPENISGNWNTSLGLTYNTPLDAAKVLNLSTSTNGSFARSVGYISSQIAAPSALDFTTLSQLFTTTALSRNVARTTTLSERLSLAYRRTAWDLTLHASGTYQHSAATLLTASNLNTWSIAYGAQANAQLPWGFSLSTDIEMNSRRGYASAELNTNELVWNAQLSRSFLKSKALTVSLKVYDLLNAQNDISRTLTALMRQDTWNESLNYYAMLHVVYKLNIFAGNKGAQHPDNNQSMPQRMPGQRMPGGMPPMGPHRF